MNNPTKAPAVALLVACIFTFATPAFAAGITTSLPTDCSAAQMKPTINIDANGNVILRAKITSFNTGQGASWKFNVIPWLYTLGVNTSLAQTGGSFSAVSSFAVGDVIDITGRMDGAGGAIANFPGYAVIFATTLRDKTIYCKTPIVHGVSTPSKHATSTTAN